RARHALEQLHGAQVDVLLELAADGDQQAPQGDVVGDVGEADGAEEDGVEGGKLGDAVLRHHAAGLGVALAAPVEGLGLDREAESPAGGLERQDSLRYHFIADAVARYGGDPVALHDRSLSAGLW